MTNSIFSWNVYNVVLNVFLGPEADNNFDGGMSIIQNQTFGDNMNIKTYK